MEGSLSEKDFHLSLNKRPIGASHGLPTLAFKLVKHHNPPLPTGRSRRRNTHAAASICVNPSLGRRCLRVDANYPFGRSFLETSILSCS
jgi:hypothetical protein